MYCRVTHTALSKFIEGGAIWVRSLAVQRKITAVWAMLSVICRYTGTVGLLLSQAVYPQGTPSEVVSCVFGLCIVFSSEHDTMLFPAYPMELLVCSSAVRVRELKAVWPTWTQWLSPRQVQSQGWVGFGLVFLFLGIAVHCVFHGHHINHFSKYLAVEKSLGSRSCRDSV